MTITMCMCVCAGKSWISIRFLVHLGELFFCSLIFFYSFCSERISVCACLPPLLTYSSHIIILYTVIYSGTFWITYLAGLVCANRNNLWYASYTHTQTHGKWERIRQLYIWQKQVKKDDWREMALACDRCWTLFLVKIQSIFVQTFYYFFLMYS